MKMFRRSSKKRTKMRNRTPQAIWRHMVTVENKKSQKKKKLMRWKIKRLSGKEISHLCRDGEITHNALNQPINLLDQSACRVCIT